MRKLFNKSTSNQENMWDRLLELLLERENLKEQRTRKRMMKIRHLLTERFNNAEVQEICFDLGIDYENFSNEKNKRIMSLLETINHRNMNEDLIAWIYEHRPDVKPEISVILESTRKDADEKLNLLINNTEDLIQIEIMNHIFTDSKHADALLKLFSKYLRTKCFPLE